MAIHIDMDAYFASIEQRDVPLYRGKPLIVCHTDNPSSIKGIVAASSYEARRYGVKSAMSVLEAKRLCPNGIYVKGNYDKYLHSTKQLHQICRRFTDRVDVYSIDEFFLRLEGDKLFGGEVKAAIELQNAIERELELSSSVGIGPNRLVAKMASEFRKPKGLTLIEEDDLPAILAPLPVDKLIGVGRRMKAHFMSLGVDTVGDLSRLPDEELKRRFGVVGLALKNAALGKEFMPANNSFNMRSAVRSFGHSSALGPGVSDIQMLTKVLLGLTEGVTRRMRREHYLGRTITLRLSMARLFTISRSKSIDRYTDLTEDVHAVAARLLKAEKTLVARYPVTTIGISVSSLVDAGDGYQMSIFDLLQEPENKLAPVLDAIKNKFGERAVFRASLADWQRGYHAVPRSEMPNAPSPAYSLR